MSLLSSLILITLHLESQRPGVRELIATAIELRRLSLVGGGSASASMNARRSTAFVFLFI